MQYRNRFPPKISGDAVVSASSLEMIFPLERVSFSSSFFNDFFAPEDKQASSWACGGRCFSTRLKSVLLKLLCSFSVFFSVLLRSHHLSCVSPFFL